MERVPLGVAQGVDGTGGTRVPAAAAAVSAGTVLVYGYDLGGSGRWKVLEADQDGSLVLDWYGYDDDAEDNFEWAAAEQLLTTLGCAEPWDTQGYWSRVLEAPSRAGVRIVRHGTEHEPMYALATAVVPVPVPVEQTGRAGKAGRPGDVGEAGQGDEVDEVDEPGELDRPGRPGRPDETGATAGAGGGPLPAADPAWDETLRSVLSVLRLTPAQGMPRWLRVTELS